MLHVKLKIRRAAESSILLYRRLLYSYKTKEPSKRPFRSFSAGGRSDSKW